MTEAAGPRPTLGRDLRIRREAEFRAVYARRARAADERLAVYALARGRPPTRLGISVGRRLGGGSVERNRTKRLIREAFREGRAAWPTGFDVVVVALGRDYTLREVQDRLRRLVPEAIRRAQRTAS
jgi:ribonuclease P protein component